MARFFFQKEKPRDQMFRNKVVMDGVSFNGTSKAAGIDAIGTMNAAVDPRLKVSDAYCSSSSNQPAVQANGVDFFPSVPVTCGSTERYC